MNDIHIPESGADSLTGVALDVSLEQALQVAQQHFGISGTIKKLHSERDHNFHIQADDQGYVLKITHPAEEALTSNFQTLALLHIEQADPTLPVQRVVRSLSGEVELRLTFSGQVRTVRVVTYLEGQLLRHAPVSLVQQYNLGAVLARLDRALASFEHPAADHVLLWDIQRADHLKGMLTVFEHEPRVLMHHYLQLFEQQIKPFYRTLRTQVVHNDLNSDNALVAPDDPDRVAAILDFGDMVKTPLINDVAVGVSYQLGEDSDLLIGANSFLKGFNSVTPLQEKELTIVHDLIMIRMVIRITLTEWRATRFPENREYILRNTARSWRQFEQLRKLGREAVELALFAGLQRPGAN